MNRRISLAAALLWSTFCMATPSDAISDDLAFQFLTCGNFEVVFVKNPVPSDDTAFIEHEMRKKIGEALRNARSHRGLFSPDKTAPSELRIGFILKDGFYFVSMGFAKLFYDLFSNVFRYDVTWQDEGSLEEGGEAELMEAFSKTLDKFLARFAAANTTDICNAELPRLRSRADKLAELVQAAGN